jgi:class 3 adenylate cyclase
LAQKQLEETAMSAPESNTESQITVTTPVILSEGQRSLAAIVFTDVANFSALMSRDEERTHRLVARDMAAMRATFVDFGGQVLKSTGDGLLVLFASAVQAVGCALEIQRDFREVNRTLPSGERLAHRIGIHIGDVIRQQGDVMGDGVNVAARVQAEGTPGGVCVSNTVYDVVKNRVPFFVTSRQTRKLKNVGTFVVYQIAPRGGAYHYLNLILDWFRFGKRKWLRFAAIAITLISLSFLPHGLVINFSGADNWQKSASLLDPLGSMLKGPGDGGISISDDDDDTPEARGSYPAPGKIAATDEDFEVARFGFMRRYDFRAMGDWLEKHDSPDVDEDRLARVAVAMQQLFDWGDTQLAGYSAAAPLVVPNGERSYAIWPAPGDGIEWRTGTGLLSVTKEQIPPAILAEMLAKLIQEKAPTDGSAELWRSLNYFVSTYRIQLSSELKKKIEAGAKGATKS